jgi:hypothetical protein
MRREDWGTVDLQQLRKAMATDSPRSAGADQNRHSQRNCALPAGKNHLLEIDKVTRMENPSTSISLQTLQLNRGRWMFSQWAKSNSRHRKLVG